MQHIFYKKKLKIPQWSGVSKRNHHQYDVCKLTENCLFFLYSTKTYKIMSANSEYGQLN